MLPGDVDHRLAVIEPDVATADGAQRLNRAPTADADVEDRAALDLIVEARQSGCLARLQTLIDIRLEYRGRGGVFIQGRIHTFECAHSGPPPSGSGLLLELVAPRGQE